jgi:hypothetical protein
MEENGIDNGEDGSIRPDPEGQSNHCYCGKGGRFAHIPQGKAHILKKVLQGCLPADEFKDAAIKVKLAARRPGWSTGHEPPGHSHPLFGYTGPRRNLLTFAVAGQLVTLAG